MTPAHGTLSNQYHSNIISNIHAINYFFSMHQMQEALIRQNTRFSHLILILCDKKLQQERI